MSDIKYSTYIDDVAFKKAFELYNQRAENRYADIPKALEGSPEKEVLLVGSEETPSDASVTYKVPDVKYDNSTKTLSVPKISATDSISADNTISAATVKASSDITLSASNQTGTITVTRGGINAEGFSQNEIPTIKGFAVTSDSAGAIANLSGGESGAVPYQWSKSETRFFKAGEPGQVVFSDSNSKPEFRKIKLADISDLSNFIATEADIKGLFTK